MINIVLRLRKANVKWLRNFYLINKYGIIREEILCIIHVFIYNTFNTNNTNNMLLHLCTYTFLLHWLHSWFYYQIEKERKNVMVDSYYVHEKSLVFKREFVIAKRKTVRKTDSLLSPQSLRLVWRRWPSSPDFFCVDCQTFWQIRRSKNPMLNILNLKNIYINIKGFHVFCNRYKRSWL